MVKGVSLLIQQESCLFSHSLEEWLKKDVSDPGEISAIKVQSSDKKDSIGTWLLWGTEPGKKLR